MVKQAVTGILYAAISLLIGLPAQAQTAQARREMMLYNYAAAIPLLEKTWNKGDTANRIVSARLLAECYMKQRDYGNACLWSARVLRTGGKDAADLFRLAGCLRSMGKYDSARMLFIQYDALRPADPAGKRYAAFCDSALAWISKPPTALVWNAAPLNTSQSEFATFPSGSMLFFTSDREISPNTEEYGWTGNAYLSLYQAMLGSGDSCSLPSSPRPGPREFRMNFHAGPVCFNAAFDEAFLNVTTLRSDRGRKDSALVRTHLLKIFRSVKKNGKWTTPEPFFLNSENYSVGHPSLSPDGKILYFVSDMPGGLGGTDIWACTRREQGWDAPRNLGKPVNTYGDEMFPWISADGTLYFSGDEHAGFGGLDIFFCRSQGNSWEIPVNAGSPLNSPADDFAAVITGSKACTDHACGFFSSNRPGGKGGDDIWGFRLLPAPPSSPPLAAMPPAIAEKPSDVPEAYSVGKTYRIENIYYDFDKWNIRKDAEKSLDSLLAILREYPIIVEIGSHTDCRGSGEYNQVLSERRAASVVSYLVGKGIDPSRLSFKGYGKTRLINACDCEKGHECSEAMHQANRRTEFTVTGYKTAPSSASEKNIILRK